MASKARREPSPSFTGRTEQTFRFCHALAHHMGCTRDSRTYRIYTSNKRTWPAKLDVYILV